MFSEIQLHCYLSEISHIYILDNWTVWVDYPMELSLSQSASVMRRLSGFGCSSKETARSSCWAFLRQYISVSCLICSHLSARTSSNINCSDVYGLKRKYVDAGSRSRRIVWTAADIPQKNITFISHSGHSLHTYIHAYIQCESNPPKVYLHFFQTVWNFSTKLYTHIIRFYLYWTTNFYPIICNFDEVMPY